MVNIANNAVNVTEIKYVKHQREVVLKKKHFTNNMKY